MKVADFEKIKSETPEYMARFSITRIPDWVHTYGGDENVVKGDYYLYHVNDVMIPEKVGSCSLSPYPSMFKFVGYVRVKRRTLSDGYDVIE